MVKIVPVELIYAFAINYITWPKTFQDVIAHTVSKRSAQNQQ